MPFMTTVDRTFLTLKQVANWIAYDNFTGPTSLHLQSFHQQALERYPDSSPDGWLARDLRQHYEAAAWDALLNALRDGDLIALGHFSDHAVVLTVPGDLAHGWKFHSGRLTAIAPDFWRSADFDANYGRLSHPSGQYIDIVVQKFFVLSLWPLATPITPPSPPSPTLQDMANYTPYLTLVKQAVAHFWKKGMPPQREKKEEMVRWLLDQHVEGLPKDKLSQNICDAIATMIRPLEAQKGGLQKVYQPLEGASKKET